MLSWIPSGPVGSCRGRSIRREKITQKTGGENRSARREQLRRAPISVQPPTHTARRSRSCRRERPAFQPTPSVPGLRRACGEDHHARRSRAHCCAPLRISVTLHQLATLTTLPQPRPIPCRHRTTQPAACALPATLTAGRRVAPHTGHVPLGRAHSHSQCPHRTGRSSSSAHPP